jgi:hypothetical protein
MASAARKSTTDLKVPDAVIDTGKQIWTKLWDKDCPFASLYIWIIIVLALYYLFWLPEITLHTSADTIVGKKVDKNIRGYLLLSLILSGLAGYYIIRQGCKSAGPYWSILWFFVALLITYILTQLILASTLQITVADSSKILNDIQYKSAR